MKKIKAVIFDAGGVIHESNSVVTDDLVKELALEETVLKQIWKTQIPLLGAGEVDEVEFWKQLRENYDVRQVELAENLLGRAFTKALKPHTEVLDLVEQLKEHGISVAILSNTIEPHARALHEAGLYKPFDRLFLSHEVGMRKPGEQIYKHVLKELAVEPKEAVFIDDDPENVQGAEKVRINGIVFTSPEQLSKDLQALLPELTLSK